MITYALIFAVSYIFGGVTVPTLVSAAKAAFAAARAKL